MELNLIIQYSNGVFFMFRSLAGFYRQKTNLFILWFVGLFITLSRLLVCMC